MQEKIKLVKAYLYKMLEKDDFSSIVCSKHNIIDDWYYVYLTGKNEKDTLRVLISSSGVINFKGQGNFKALEVMNTINHILEDEYYDILLNHIKSEIKEIK